MTETIDVTTRLTQEERQKVRVYAESLIASRPPDQRDAARTHVDVDALMGMFAGMGGDKTDKELIREAWDEIAAKYDD